MIYPLNNRAKAYSEDIVELIFRQHPLSELICWCSLWTTEKKSRRCLCASNKFTVWIIRGSAAQLSLFHPLLFASIGVCTHPINSKSMTAPVRGEAAWSRTWRSEEELLAEAFGGTRLWQDRRMMASGIPDWLRKYRFCVKSCSKGSSTKQRYTKDIYYTTGQTLL